MILILILFLLTGVISGVLAGLLGVGGGVIVVPLLVFIFKNFNLVSDSYIAQVAAGTSLAAMIVTSSMSVYAHNKKGNVDFYLVKKLLFGVLVGVIAGAILSSMLHSRVLEIMLGIVLILMSFYMLFVNQPRPERVLPGWFFRTLIAFAIGFKSGLLGLGGGAILIPFLVFCNVPMRKASGASACCTLPIAIVGTISYALLGMGKQLALPDTLGFVYLPAFVCVAIASVLCVPLGIYLGSRLNVNVLKKTFAVFLFLVSLKVLID